MTKLKKNTITIDDVNLFTLLNFNFPPSKKKKFTEGEKLILRPIAEVLCLLDGNAFFGMSTDEDGKDLWYEQYLPEAYRIYIANGGKEGWAGQASWIRNFDNENQAVEEAYSHWQLLKMLSQNKK
jgi:hypothetical protein